jgi:hypothetical protein
MRISRAATSRSAVAAVTVEENQTFHPAGGNALRNIGQHGKQGRRTQRQGAGKPRVLGTAGDRKQRQD